MRSMTTRSLLVVAGLALSIAAPAALAQTTATWTGAGGNTLWSNPANWSGNVVPINTATTRYIVVIPIVSPYGDQVVIDSSLPASFSVDAIQITGISNAGFNPILSIQNGRTLTVADDAGPLNGIQVDAGSSFTATGSTGPFRAGRINAYNGSTIRTAATSAQSSTSTSGGVAPLFFDARGTGSLIDGRSLTSLSFSGGNGFYGGGASAQSNAVVDLSNVTSITDEGGAGFRVVANPGENTTRLDLSNLRTLTSNSFQPTGFVVYASNRAVGINLSRLTSITNNGTNGVGAATFQANGGTIDISSLNSLGTINSIYGYTFESSSGGLVDARSLTSTGNSNLINIGAYGAGSVVDLRSLQSLSSASSSNANFTVQNSGTLNLSSLTNLGAGNVNAYISDATLDLRSVTTLGTGPRNSFTAGGDTGGLIDLSNLTNLNAASGERRFTVSGRGRIDISRVSNLNGATLELNGADSRITLNPALSGTLTGASITAQFGATFTVPGAVTTYDFGRLAGFQQAFWAIGGTGTPARIDGRSLTTLVLNATGNNISATRRDAVVDLSNVTSALAGPGAASSPVLLGTTDDIQGGGGGGLIDLSRLASFPAGTGLAVTNTRGGTVDLRALTSLANAGSVSLTSSGAFSTGLINLSGLTDLGSRANSNTTRSISVSRGGTIDLSSLTRLNDTQIIIDNTPFLNAAPAALLIPNVANVDGSSFNIASTTFALPASITSYNDNGGATFNANSNGTLDFRSLRTVRFASLNVQGINGTAQADLTGVTSWIAAGSNSRLGAIASASTQLRFGDLNLPVGSLALNASSGGRINAGNISALMGTTTIRIDAGASIAARSLTLNNNFDVLAISGPASFAPTPSFLQLSGNFSHRSTRPQSFDTSNGTIRFTDAGFGNNFTFEVAGRNLGASALFSDYAGNFGLGQLVLGDVGAPVNLTLVDLFDNGQRLAGVTSDAFYLFGLRNTSTNQILGDGLILQGGSRLLIGDTIPVYARIGSSLTDLRTLFAPGQTEVSFGDGFIVIPSPGVGSMLALAGVLATRRRR